MKTSDRARYSHDCDRCLFLGRHKRYDLYVCARDNVIDTVIARYGSDGPEYASGLVFAVRKMTPALVEALSRAQSRGFVVVSEFGM